MSRTGLWILTIVFIPVAGMMGLVTYIELINGRSLQTAFYIILFVVWYIFLSLFFSVTTRESSLPNRLLSYPITKFASFISKINPRFFTAMIVLGAISLLSYWAFVLPLDSIVLIENYTCKPGAAKATTLWPAVFVLLVGYISLNYTVYGEAYLFYRDNHDEPSKKTKQLQYLIKYVVIILATIFSFIALYRLGSLSILKNTGTSAVTAIWSILLIIGALALVVGLMILIFGFKQRRVDKQVKLDLSRISMNERESIVSMIDRHARTSEYSLLHCRFITPISVADLNIKSHFGGTPYIEDINEFPISADESNEKVEFLLQLKLSASRLGDVWQGRLIVVYLNDWEIEIRSYQNPSDERCLDIPDYHATYPCLSFTPLAIPFVSEPSDYDEYSEEEEHVSGFEIESIIQKTPGLKDIINKYTKHDSEVLTKLIDPHHSFHSLDMDSMILEGGDPVLIQNPHDAICSVCNSKMRFLFQFGEITGELQLGDAGQVYVYGCDEHPEECEGFIDCY